MSSADPYTDLVQIAHAAQASHVRTTAAWAVEEIDRLRAALDYALRCSEAGRHDDGERADVEARKLDA